MEQIVDQHILIKGVRLAHGVRGMGEPVVLIHGTPSSSLIWRNILPSLVNAGYRAHLYDLLGFGLSERPWDPNIDTSVTAQVPILEHLLQAWGLNCAHIIAHDIGGGVAQQFSLKAPDRVRSLTLIDTVSFDSWPSKRTRTQMQAGLERLSKAAEMDHRNHFRAWLHSAVEHKDRLANSAMETYLDFISGPIGQASFFQHQVRHYDSKHTLEVAPRYGELGNIPVQLIWGADDAWQDPHWAHKLNRAIPNSQLHIVENCGHFAMEDAPEQVSQLLISFLKANPV